MRGRSTQCFGCEQKSVFATLAMSTTCHYHIEKVLQLCAEYEETTKLVIDKMSAADLEHRSLPDEGATRGQIVT